MSANPYDCGRTDDAIMVGSTMFEMMSLEWTPKSVPAQSWFLRVAADVVEETVFFVLHGLGIPIAEAWESRGTWLQ